MILQLISNKTHEIIWNKVPIKIYLKVFNHKFLIKHNKVKIKQKDRKYNCQKYEQIDQQVF